MKTYSLNCNGRLLVLDSPKIMGIINVTPDSFYTQGMSSDMKGVLHTADRMIADGATVLDVGGMSTRPGSNPIAESEEIDRVASVIYNIKKYFPEIFVSIDTYRSAVAKVAFENGADMVNDISAGAMDTTMLQTVSDLNIPYIAMHMQGVPSTMQEAPEYKNVTEEVLQYCADKMLMCRSAGIKDVIIDPGFGFGKTVEQNYILLKQLHTFSILDVPIMVGLSRKSMLYKLLKTTPKEALNATSIVHTLALQQGVHLLRVHDVKEAKEAVNLWNMYQAL
jgi:dihydropteroate synthase